MTLLKIKTMSVHLEKTFRGFSESLFLCNSLMIAPLLCREAALGSLRSVAGNLQHLTDIQNVAGQPVQAFDRVHCRAKSLC